MLRCAHHGLDPLYGTDHGLKLPPVAEVAPVRGHPPSEVDGPAHVEPPAVGVQKPVDARSMRQLPDSSWYLRRTRHGHLEVARRWRLASVGLAVGRLHDPDVVAERVTDADIGTVGLFAPSSVGLRPGRARTRERYVWNSA